MLECILQNLKGEKKHWNNEKRYILIVYPLKVEF